MATIYGRYNRRGHVAPEALRLRVECDGFTPASVTSAEIEMYPVAGGPAIRLDAVVTSADDKYVWITHLWRDTDITQRGSYVIVTFLHIPTGVVRAEPRKLFIRDTIIEAP